MLTFDLRRINLYVCKLLIHIFYHYKVVLTLLIDPVALYRLFYTQFNDQTACASETEVCSGIIYPQKKLYKYLNINKPARPRIHLLFKN